MKKKFAFTLTEILIALGVIGIVSAITVPALSNNWQKRAHATKLHKVYNDFQHALERYMTDNRASNLFEVVGGTPNAFLNNYFKVVKTCGGNISAGCFADSYKTIEGTVTNNPNFTGQNVVLANGVAVAYSRNNAANAAANRITTTYGTLIVDINGVQGPNIAGRDLFEMIVFPDGVLDVGTNTINCRTNNNAASCGNTNATANRTAIAANCENTLITAGCFARLLNDNWVMNY